jgi:hypothetical protein
MPENNSPRSWTSDHLMKPDGTALYAAQQRERFRQMADEVQALLREYRADLESVKFDGDKPFEAWLRAYWASRPLAHLEDDLRSAVKNAGRLDREYIRFYVKLPERREKRAKEKALEKARKKGIADTRGMNTAAQLNGLAAGISEPADDKGLEKLGSVYAPPQGGSKDQTFMDFLQQRGA